MTNLHIKHHGLAVNIIPVLHHGDTGGLGECFDSDIENQNISWKQGKGMVLHKTNRTNTLKGIAVEILSGQNQCFPLQ